MALSDEQKAKNKAANAVKRRAHSQRCRLMQAAVAAAEAATDVLDAKSVADAANERAEAAWQAREDRIAQLRAQIAEIEAQIEAVRNDRAGFVDRDAARAAFARWRELKDSKVAEAEAGFPDMAGCARWSSVAWEPPQDVRDAMDAARTAVHAA